MGTVENVFIIRIWLPFSLWMHIIFQSEMSAKISPSSSIGDVCINFSIVFSRRCLQKLFYRLHSSVIIIFYILKQTQILVFIHIFWKYVILEMFIGDLPKSFSVVFMSSNHRHHLHTLKQTQNFVFIHILQYVILEVFAESSFGNMDRFLMFHVCCVFSASSSSDWYICSLFAFLFSFSKSWLILWLVELFSAWK